MGVCGKPTGCRNVVFPIFMSKSQLKRRTFSECLWSDYPASDYLIGSQKEPLHIPRDFEITPEFRMGGQPGKPKPPGNLPTRPEPQKPPPIEEPLRPIRVPPIERPPAP